MLIHRLIYRSDAALVGSEQDVDDQVQQIVDAADKANQAADITGALTLSGGVFIQVLEGPTEAVEKTFERICGDLRHRRVRLLQLAVVDNRLFGQWSMARVTPTPERARLCQSLDAAVGVRLDATRADAALQIMRAELLAEGRRPSRLELVVPSAPGIPDRG